jgi:hypothetical protein
VAHDPELVQTVAGILVTIDTDLGDATFQNFEQRRQAFVIGACAILSALDLPSREARVRAEVAEDLAVLAEVGRMYLTALDADPENEMLTLTEALKVTMVRDAVARAEAGDSHVTHAPDQKEGSAVGEGR